MKKNDVDLARLQTLEQENLILKKQVADQEKIQEAQAGNIGDRLTSEMKKIRQKGKSESNTIVVVTNADYKPVSLWTKWGNQVGPMHPDNAIQALHRFAEIGVALSVDKPTAEQCEAYSKTAECKERVRKEDERRATKEKSRKSGQMEKFTAEIAKLSGTTADAVNHILKIHEVKGAQ